MKKIIDVSHWQNTINWPKVKASGIEGAIIKAGGSDAGFYTDSRFEENYYGATSAGLSVGAYYFVGSKCTSREAGEADAKRFIDLIKGKQFTLPVYIDLEVTPTSAKAGATQACIGFCETMEAAGYFCGIYASDISGFKNRLDISQLGSYSWWVARYGSAPKYATKNMHVWQYSSSGSVDGIKGRVDMDECYVDFPSIIRSHGLNGFIKPAEDKTEEPTADAKTIEDLTAKINELQEQNEVLQGKIDDAKEALK